MEYAELGNEFVDRDEYHAMIDVNYDWSQQNLAFSNQQIELMKNGWLERQKTAEYHITEVRCPAVYRHQINLMKKFSYDIIQKYKREKKQLLMIINGGAGSGQFNIVPY